MGVAAELGPPEEADATVAPRHADLAALQGTGVAQELETLVETRSTYAPPQQGCGLAKQGGTWHAVLTSAGSTTGSATLCSLLPVKQTDLRNGCSDSSTQCKACVQYLGLTTLNDFGKHVLPLDGDFFRALPLAARHVFEPKGPRAALLAQLGGTTWTPAFQISAQV